MYGASSTYAVPGKAMATPTAKIPQQATGGSSNIQPGVNKNYNHMISNLKKGNNGKKSHPMQHRKLVQAHNGTSQELVHTESLAPIK